MGYERTLVTRWTRRDWLAIAVIALTTTFLVGTSIMILATGSQIEGEVQTLDALETVEFIDDSAVASRGGGVTLPVAHATTANGTTVTVVGLPDETAALTSSFDETTLPAPPPDDVLEHGTEERLSVRLEGSDGSTTIQVRAAPNRSVLPARWYSTRTSTVRTLGQTGRFRIETDAVANATNTSGLPAEGTLLLGTPGFLVTGGGEIVQLLGLVTLASGVLIGVTVYSVTRMTVRDRRRTLFVVRSTGGTSTRLVGLFGVRAALLTAVGAAFGYALGVILINAALNVATYYGTLTTLDVSGSPTDRLVLGTIFVVLVAIGLGAGALSVLRTAAASPASLMGTGSGTAGTDGIGSWVRETLGVELVGLRTIVPMTAALAVLIAIAVVSVSLGLTLAPLAGATDGVVMSPDASYPLQSQVNENLVASFRAAGIPASPEVLLPQVRDGQPYVMRGVNYSAYRQVSDVSLTAGREPSALDEALVGEGLARTLGVEVGEEVTVGGGTDFGIDRVTVVGRFAAQGYLDDQLLISLAAGQQLSNMADGSVQIIRTTGVEEPPNQGNETATTTPTPIPADVVVTDLSVPDTGVVNRSVLVEVRLENRGDRSGGLNLSVPVNGTDRETTVPVDGGEVRTVRLDASFRRLGRYTLTVGGLTGSIRIEQAPADVVVTDVAIPDTGLVNRDVPVDVTLENRGGQTGNLTLSVPVNGTARETTVTLNASQKRTVTLTTRYRTPGNYTVTLGQVESRIRIVEPSPADVVVTDVSVPETGVANRSVPVAVTLENRGDLPGGLNLTVPVNGTEREQTVTVEGGGERTVTLSAVFQTPGVYTITVDGIDSEVEIVEPSPADLVVTNASVPKAGFVNASIPVEVTLENRGDLAGSLNLTVPVNASEREQTVTVEGGGERTVTLPAVFQTPGVYTITVDGIDSDVEIVEPSPADVVVTNASVPEVGFVNASIPVDVTLENRGDLAGSLTLTVPVNGTERETTVTVQGGQKRAISLPAVFQSPGVYTITFGGIDSAVEIVEPSPSDIVVTDVDLPETALAGEEVPVEVTLENRGDRAGGVSLTTPVNGTERETTVTVEGGDTRIVTLVATYGTEGTYTLTVGGVESEIRIIELEPADVVVTNVSVPALGRVDAAVPVEVTLENRGDVAGNLTLAVPVNSTQRETTVTVDGATERTVSLNASFLMPGEYPLTIAGEDARIRIVESANISLGPLPGRAPPNATLLVTARDRSGMGLPGLRVRIGSERASTGADGTARLRVPSDPGRYRIESRIGAAVVHNRSLDVESDVTQSFLMTLRVQSKRVAFPDTVEVTATASNPWARTHSRELVIERAGEPVLRRTLELAPGEEATLNTTVEPATTDGAQRVRVLSEGRVLGQTTFTVEASDRLLAVLGRSGLYEPGSGLLRSLDSLLGNFQVLQVTLVVLAVLMGIGSSATVVIQATHARRRTIGIRRATGATPANVVGLLVGDGLRLGAIASLVALAAAYAGLTALVRLGYAVIFGVRIPPLLNPWLVLGVLGGALVVVAASSVLAAWWVLRVTPGGLITASTQRVPDRDGDQSSRETGVE